MAKFKDRYVLAEGYCSVSNNYKHVGMRTEPEKIYANIKLDWPMELWPTHSPKYRLVLEKVKENESY